MKRYFPPIYRVPTWLVNEGKDGMISLVTKIVNGSVNLGDYLKSTNISHLKSLIDNKPVWTVKFKTIINLSNFNMFVSNYTKQFLLLKRKFFIK